MSLDLIMAGVILASLMFYALSGGADYGGGMWDLLAFGPRARRQREAIEDAIGPIWEANHVWLILAVVVLFTAFPPAFGAIMTALHIPMTLILIGIVFRGSTFVFRKYDARDDVVHRRWSTLFGIASFLTPFFLGLSLGAMASGQIRIADGVVTSGFLAGWLGPFAIGCGLFAQGLFAFLAAAYLTVDTRGDPELQEDFRNRALFSGLSLAPAAALVFVLARADAPHIFAGLTDRWAPLLLAATSACAIWALAALWLRRYRWVRLAAAGQVACIVLGWGLAQYPYVVVPDLTFADTATSPATLRLLAWTLAAGVVLLFPSFWYLFHIFKRPISPSP